MSGVIDENGQQWEHCNVCAKMFKIENLGYEPPIQGMPESGRDICLACTNKHPHIDKILPAKSWIPQYEGDTGDIDAIPPTSA